MSGPAAEWRKAIEKALDATAPVAERVQAANDVVNKVFMIPPADKTKALQEYGSRMLKGVADVACLPDDPHPDGKTEYEGILCVAHQLADMLSTQRS
jgi:hypothetical protein